MSSEWSEPGLIGAALERPGVCAQIVSDFCVEDFGDPAARAIFGAIRALHGRGVGVSAVSVFDELGSRNGSSTELQVQLGRAIEIALPDHEIPVAVQRIRETAAQRRAGEILGRGCTAIAAAGPGQVAGLIDSTVSELLAISDKRPERSEHIRDLLPEVISGLTSGKTQGFSTGIPKLDRLTEGLKPGALYVVAGNTSSGKTAFAQCLTHHIAIRLSRPVGIFSFEMSSTDLIQRLLALECRTGLLGIDHERLIRGAQRLDEAPIRICDDPLPIDRIAARAKAWHIAEPLALIVVDYMQLVPHQGRGETREREVAEVSRGLKRLAMELRIPVIGLAQLNRASAGRSNHRPVLSDLRESGAIEQDADVVIFIHREELFQSPSDPKRMDREGQAELIVAKNRAGPQGTVDTLFDGPTSRFTEISPVETGSGRNR